jgi:hypothetical protein
LTLPLLLTFRSLYFFISILCDLLTLVGSPTDSGYA